MPLSSWHVIDTSTPWLVRVKSSDTSLEATLTNLREVYVGTCSEASVRQQVDLWGGAQPAQMLGVMHEMIDDPTFNRNAKFTVMRSGELQVLRFEVRDTARDRAAPCPRTGGRGRRVATSRKSSAAAAI
jgi:hypothetical protein